MRECDLLVIGGGSGGVRAARLAAQRGKNVILAEKNALGGTCVNIGCVPKKIFVYASSFSDDFSAAAAFGWTAANGGAHDWKTLRENKDREIARLNSVYAKLLKNAGVKVVADSAELCGDNIVRAGGEDIRADKILIATGAVPARPNLPGAALGLLSDDMFFLPSLPRRAAVVGGGYIALEFAGILAGLGVETSLCYRADLPLRGFDDDLRAHLATEIAARGVQIRAGNAPAKIDKNGDTLRLHFANGDALDTDIVLLATGRKPSLPPGLDKTGAEANERGFLEVDDDYRVRGCDSLYAVGDVLQTPALTPVATAEAGAFVARAFGDGGGGNNSSAQVDYAHIPTAVFSRPPLATVGMTESAAAKKGIAVKVHKSAFATMKNGFAGRQWKMLMKLVADEKSGKILGAHLVGEDAAEIIQGIAVAVKMGATKADFDSTIGVHPSSAEEFVTMPD